MAAGARAWHDVAGPADLSSGSRYFRLAARVDGSFAWVYICPSARGWDAVGQQAHTKKKSEGSGARCAPAAAIVLLVSALRKPLGRLVQRTSWVGNKIGKQIVFLVVA